MINLNKTYIFALISILFIGLNSCSSTSKVAQKTEDKKSSETATYTKVLTPKTEVKKEVKSAPHSEAPELVSFTNSDIFKLALKKGFKAEKDDKYLEAKTLIFLSDLSSTNKLQSNDYGISYPIAIHYGLRIDENIDERKSDEKIIPVIQEQLLKIYSDNSDWTNTFAVLLFGKNNIKLSKGAITNNWVSEIKSSGNNTSKNNASGDTYSTFSLNEKISFSTLDSINHSVSERIKQNNIELVGSEIPAKFEIKLNEEDKNWFNENAEEIAKSERLKIEKQEKVLLAYRKWQKEEHNVKYRIKSGDTLGRIAMRYKVRVKDIMYWNRMKNSRIRAGKTLIIKI